MYQWYVINTFSGQEDKVKANLQRRFAAPELRARLREICIPTHIQVEQRPDGTRVERERVRMPGYVFVHLDLTDDAWGTVIDTPGVTGFVGAAGVPSPLSASERARMLGPMTGDISPAESAPVCAVGDGVTITGGPLADFTGVVDEVNAERRVVRVRVTIFGRETLAELGFDQVVVSQ